MEENWITKKLDDYRALYQGKFWNAGLSDNALSESNWGTTNSGCYPGSCSSNMFGNSSQCYGFSLFLAYILFGLKITSNDINSANDGDVVCGGYTIYKNSSSIANQTLEPGDIIRADGHSAMVWRIGDNTSEYPGIRVAECWGNPSYDSAKPPKGCYLNWHYFNHSAYYTEDVLKRTAVFLIKAPTNTTPEPEPEVKVPVTFKKNTQSDGGPVVETREYAVGKKYGSFPAVSREGYTFDGWWPEHNIKTNRYTENSIVPAWGHTLYAHWNKIITTAKVDLCLNYTSSDNTLHMNDLEYTVGSTAGLGVNDPVRKG